MDDIPGSSSVWRRLTRVFQGKKAASVVQAILEANKSGVLDEDEGSMLLSVLELGDLQAQDIMTPRMDIVCIEESIPVSEAIEIIISSGHSRIPVYKENRDNIIGIIHAKDLITAAMKPIESASSVSAFMRETFFVPETKKALALLHEFRSRKQHLAVILDEYGGTAGLVSVEDLIEEIIGDIEDEYDAPREENIICEPNGIYIVSGRTDLEDLVETIPVSISSEEVDTIGGYLSLLAGRVPKNGETFHIGEAIFTILEADAKQIHIIKVTLEHPEAPKIMGSA